MRTCGHCGAEIPASALRWKKFCSVQHRNLAHHDREPPADLSRYKPIAEYPGYGIAADGTVVRLTRAPGAVLYKKLKGSRMRDGYFYFCLCIAGRKHLVAQHRLLAFAFLGPSPSAGHEVNHKDGNKANNAIENLEWVTRSENAKHAIAHGLTPPPPISDRRGEAHHLTTLTEQKVREIRALADNLSQSEIGRRFGVSQGTVSNILVGRTWAHVS